MKSPTKKSKPESDRKMSPGCVMKNVASRRLARARLLVALCAPRPTFISVGSLKVEGTWIDAKGSFLAGLEAGPVTVANDDGGVRPRGAQGEYRLVEEDPRRAAVDDYAECGAVALAEAGDDEALTERVRRHRGTSALGP